MNRLTGWVKSDWAFVAALLALMAFFGLKAAHAITPVPPPVVYSTSPTAGSISTSQVVGIMPINKGGTGSGSGVPAAIVLTGALGSGVIASSIAVNAVGNASIVAVSGSKVTGNIPGNAASISGTVDASQVVGLPVSSTTASNLSSTTINGPLTVAGSTLTITGGNDLDYSMCTASGIFVGQGVTALFFEGNGSHLTGVTATDASKVAKTGDTMSGSLTATAFIGDGAGLTNLPSSGGSFVNTGGTLTLTGLGLSGYSMQTSSGILIQDGDLQVNTCNFSVNTSGVHDSGCPFYVNDNSLTLTGSAGYIKNDSSITTSGTVYAGSFSGDGSGITGLTSATPGACVDGDVLVSTGGKVGCVGQPFRYEIGNSPASLTLQRTLNISKILMGSGSTDILQFGSEGYLSGNNAGGLQLQANNGFSFYGYGGSALRIIGGGISMETPLSFAAGSGSISGNVGINTVSPLALLDVNGKALIRDAAIHVGTITVQGGNDTDASVTTSSGIAVVSGIVTAPEFVGGGSHLTGITATASPAGAEGDIQINRGGATGAVSTFTLTSAGVVSIGNSPTKQAVDIVGMVMIGTTTAPSARLHIMSGVGPGPGTYLLKVSSSTTALLTVQVNGSVAVPVLLDIGTEQVYGGDASANFTVNCPAGKTIMGGGGSCTGVGGMTGTFPASSTSWRTTCTTTGGVYAYAICGRLQQ